MVERRFGKEGRRTRRKKVVERKEAGMGGGQRGSSGKPEKMKDESPEPRDHEKPRVCRFPLLVAVLQLLLAAAVVVVAFLTLAVSPSLLARETPHWAGIFLLLVSLLGLILYCVTRRPNERSSLQFCVKLLYFLLCVVGLVVSLLVVAFASHHYAQVGGFSCERAGEDCACRLQPQDPVARVFTYEGVDDCESVASTLAVYFLLQILLNVAQALVCAVAAFLMWKNRYQVFFAGLQISSPPWQRV